MGHIRSFVEIPDRPCWLQYRLERFHYRRLDGLEELVSVNPFDDDAGSFFVLVNGRGATQPVAGLGCCSSRLAGGLTAKRTALGVWITSNRIGPIYGRGVCARGLAADRAFD